jgi:hypothetical protein
MFAMISKVIASCEREPWMNRQTPRCLTIGIALIEVVRKPGADEEELQSAQDQREDAEHGYR